MSETDRKRLLKQDHHQKINYALAKAFLDDDDVYRLVKDFFAAYLNLDYEFTHEELIKELNKQFIDEALKKQIMQFLANLSVLQFNSETSPTQQQLRNMIEEFKTIINKLILFEEQHTRKGMFTPLLVWLKTHTHKPTTNKQINTQQTEREIPTTINKTITTTGVNMSTTPTLPQQSPTPQAVPTPPTSFNKQQTNTLPVEIASSPVPKPARTPPQPTPSLLIDAISADIASHNMQHARSRYPQLLSLYNQLPETEKQQYFSIIKSFYQQLAPKR